MHIKPYLGEEIGCGKSGFEVNRGFTVLRSVNYDDHLVENYRIPNDVFSSPFSPRNSLENGTKIAIIFLLIFCNLDSCEIIVFYNYQREPDIVLSATKITLEIPPSHSASFTPSYHASWQLPHI